jgi:hypothetical protein
MFQYDSFLERDRAADEQRNVVSRGVAVGFSPGGLVAVVETGLVSAAARRSRWIPSPAVDDEV